MTACPLCSGKNIDFYHADAAREYLHCEGCELVFVASQFHLKPAGEKARYDLHRNTTEDDGYIRFLSRLADPLLERLPSGQFGLDFGCGPGPVLSEILKKAGHRIELFDPYYRNDRQVLNMKFDFITATEVVEHMSRPGIEFERLFEMLKSGGNPGAYDPDGKRPGILRKLALYPRSHPYQFFQQPELQIFGRAP